MSGRRTGFLVALLLAVAAAGATYMVGYERRATPADAAHAGAVGRVDARRHAAADAERKARKRGYKRGLSRGQANGRSAGNRNGTAAGERVALERRPATATVQTNTVAATPTSGPPRQDSDAAQRARNCGAPLFVDGYCPTDEEVRQEGQAESLCGGGDYDAARAEGISCFPPDDPRNP